jgi:putative membrane protein insertion efficiency factor
MILLIKFYQKYLSLPLRGIFGGGCRFQPTCSEYAIRMIRRYGVGQGSVLALKRFLRCNPFYKGD